MKFQGHKNETDYGTPVPGTLSHARGIYAGHHISQVESRVRNFEFVAPISPYARTNYYNAGKMRFMSVS